MIKIYIAENKETINLEDYVKKVEELKENLMETIKDAEIVVKVKNYRKKKGNKNDE